MNLNPAVDTGGMGILPMVHGQDARATLRGTDGRMVRAVARGGLGVLPDAEPRASDRRAADGRGAVPGHWRGAPALHPARELLRA